MTATYDCIATTTLGSAQSSITFSSISGAYTDLILICHVKYTANPSYAGIRFNGDSAGNYSNTLLRGNGSSATSSRNSNAGQIVGGSYTTGFTVDRFNIMNYSNSTTNKTVLRRGDQSDETGAAVGLWRNTNAITSVSYIIDTGNLDTGSTFALYGVKAE